MINLITGANRGIGYELAKILVTRGEVVWAAHRHPRLQAPLADLKERYADRLHPVQIDVTKPEQIQAAASQVREVSGRLDVLINNAGVFPRGENPGNLNEMTLMETFRINSVGPMSVAREMLPLLASSQAGKIINISSQLGSLERKTNGGDYSYCSSKAALNMLTRALAADVRQQGITVVVVHPGWVQTDMGGSGASLTPSQSATGLVNLIEKLRISDTGGFFTWDGRIHPW